MPEALKRTLVLGKSPDPNNLKGILALKNETGKNLITFFKGTGQEKHFLKFIPPITTVANGGTIHIVVMRRNALDSGNRAKTANNTCYFDIEYTPIPLNNFNPNLPKMWTKIPRCQIASAQILGRLETGSDMLGKPQVIRIKSLEQKPSSLFFMENDFLWPNKQYNVQAKFPNSIQSGDQAPNISGEFLWPSKPYGGKLSGNILHNTAHPASTYHIKTSLYEDCESMDSLARTASCVNGHAENENGKKEGEECENGENESSLATEAPCEQYGQTAELNNEFDMEDSWNREEQMPTQFQQQNFPYQYQEQNFPYQYQQLPMAWPQAHSFNQATSGRPLEESLNWQQRCNRSRLGNERRSTRGDYSDLVPLVAILATFGAIMMSTNFP